MSRKRRIVKNGYVDFDDVKCKPFDDFSNWTRICKMKLKQREHIMLNMRINQVQHIINNEIKLFVGTNSSLMINCPLFIKQCLLTLYDEIDSWKGVNINKMSNPAITLHSFQEYFKRGKNRWEQAKQMAYCRIWYQIFIKIYNFLNENIENSNHKKYALYNVFRVIFNADIKFAATKSTPLIQEGCLRKSSKIHTFLFNQLHDSLNLELWTRNGKQLHTKVLPKVRQKLEQLCHDTRNGSSHSSHSQTPPATTQPLITTTTATAANWVNSAPFIILTPTQMPMSHNVNTLNTYNGYHQSTNTVLDARFNPVIFIVSSNGNNNNY